MFAACRRGAGSARNLSRTASSLFAPVIRSSALPLSVRTSTRQPNILRCLNTSSALAYRGARTQAPRNHSHNDEEYLEEGTVSHGATMYTKFQELADNGLVNESVIREITHGMGHQTMTEVQKLTINETLKGRDTIAQARTGTGKTLGFLIPVVQNILNKSPELATRQMTRSSRATASDIRAIIISPTRELAEQIAVEARKITKNTAIQVQVAVGGNSKQYMLRQMQQHGCHLLVATPGRLNDILTDPYTRVSAPDLSTLVLDEADRLLDAGFADEIQDIMRSLPDIQRQDRQTMMFSATVPREVMSLVRTTLKEDFQFVQTIQRGEQATHEKVPQKIVEVAGLENMMPALLELCKREIEESKLSNDAMPFKALVYLNATASVELAGSIFENLRSSTSDGPYARHPLWPTEISRMYGKMTQQQRTRVSDRFRYAKSGIMFSSDVTARGMDFPNVTHVIQIGLAMDRDQYIHRIGRTGRGDKPGQGWLMVTTMEGQAVRRRLKGLPLIHDKSLETASVNMTQDAQLPAAVAETLTQVTNATKMVDKETKAMAYMAALSTMNYIDNKQGMIDAMNRWTRYGWGWEEPPPLGGKLVALLGLKGLSGVTTREGVDRFNGRSGNDRFGGGFSRDNDRRDRGGFGGSRGGYGGSGGGFGGSRGGESDFRRGNDHSGGGFSRNNDRGGERGSGRGSNDRGRGFGQDRGFGEREKPAYGQAY